MQLGLLYVDGADGIVMDSLGHGAPTLDSYQVLAVVSS